MHILVQVSLQPRRCQVREFLGTYFSLGIGVAKILPKTEPPGLTFGEQFFEIGACSRTAPAATEAVTCWYPGPQE
ncbi:MAG: hypothetical protein CSA33_00815 [Desulfobulbus propionicus]|nr:MAG: hypothetical protein CSA33_00815 [Desulfobulbus propionicus]